MRTLLVGEAVELVDDMASHCRPLGYEVERCAAGDPIPHGLDESSFDLMILGPMRFKRDAGSILADLTRPRNSTPPFVTIAFDGWRGAVGLPDPCGTVDRIPDAGRGLASGAVRAMPVTADFRPVLSSSANHVFRESAF